MKQSRVIEIYLVWIFLQKEIINNIDMFLCEDYRIQNGQCVISFDTFKVKGNENHKHHFYIV